MVTGILLVNIPNKSHSKVPAAKSVYIDNEMLLVSFVRMVLIACGKKEVVVKAAAKKPVSVIKFIFYFLIKKKPLQMKVGIFAITIPKTKFVHIGAITLIFHAYIAPIFSSFYRNYRGLNILVLFQMRTFLLKIKKSWQFICVFYLPYNAYQTCHLF